MNLTKFLLVSATGAALLLASGTLADSPREPARDPLLTDLPPTPAAEPTAGSLTEWTESALPDFRAVLDAALRKQRFLSFLLPLVQAENARLTAIRTRLSYIYDHVRWHRELADPDRVWLRQIARDYSLVLDDSVQPEFWEAAFERVDAVPEELVLVQAANESGWGTSRFAREGNNLFGQWCYRAGCGIVPAGRPAGARYEVARYASISESIGSYIHNLNTGANYQMLREIRLRMRREGREPDATELAAGLLDYSARGVAYVDELRAMIRHNAAFLATLRLSAETDGKR